MDFQTGEEDEGGVWVTGFLGYSWVEDDVADDDNDEGPIDDDVAYHV